MRLHRRMQTHPKQYASDGDKKTPPAAKYPGGAVSGKKERDIRPRYCTAPSRVFSNK